MSKTYKDQQAARERRVYRCADCGNERYSTRMPEGWQPVKRQYAGRHTVWCACDACGEGSQSSAVGSTAAAISSSAALPTLSAMYERADRS